MKIDGEDVDPEAVAESNIVTNDQLEVAAVKSKLKMDSPILRKNKENFQTFLCIKKIVSGFWAFS